MLFRLLKKISKNLGVFISLLLGIVISLVIINATIMYGNVLKDDLFHKQMSDFELKNNVSAGTINITDSSLVMEDVISDRVVKQDLDALSELDLNIEVGRNLALAQYSIFWDSSSDTSQKDFYTRNYDLISIHDFQNHVEMVQGRMYSSDLVGDEGGIIEVVVDQKTYLEMKLEMDKLYPTMLISHIEHQAIQDRLKSKAEDNQALVRFKVVGVYKLKEGDSFWRRGYWKNDKNTFLAHEKALGDFSVYENIGLQGIREYFLDLSQFRYTNRQAFIKAYEKIEETYEVQNDEIFLNVGNTVKKDDKNFALVSNMLWIIQVPVFAILFLYILMITSIIVERDKDEIALLKSRGATRFNILSHYAFDGSLILLVALITAPGLAIVAAKYMSITSGFLEFQGIVSKNLYFSPANLIFSLLAGLFFLLALLLPAYKASKDDVVNRKQSKVRIKISKWQSTFIDFILIAVGLYGFSMFKRSQEVAENLSKDINYITLDPLIFISATVLAFGMALAFLRFYPYFIKGIFRVFKKVMPPNIYVLFSNLGRKPGKREYVMLFIVVMISSSIFNLKIARTINTNVTDNIKYSEGADVVIKGSWVKDKGNEFGQNEDEKPEMGQNLKPDLSMFDVLNYSELIEPNYDQFETLETLDHVAKVLTIKNTALEYSGSLVQQVDLMAIEPDDFGRVAYMRDDLSEVHWHHYLNILSEKPNAVFFSSNLDVYDKFGIEIGDPIEIDVYQFKETVFFAGYFDYWPGYVDRDKYMMIGNFNFAYTRLARFPYQVWGKLDQASTENDLFRELQQKDVDYSDVNSISSLTKENIFLKAVNASITIAFIMSMVVTLLGFVIYWVICIRERELQFGILRSLGLKVRKINTMIVIEQFLVTGVSLVVGIGVGQFISSTYLPAVTKIVFGTSLVLPVFDYISSSDYYMIISIFIVSVLCVLTVILRYISKLKISQAVKIGED